MPGHDLHEIEAAANILAQTGHGLRRPYETLTPQSEALLAVAKRGESVDGPTHMCIWAEAWDSLGYIKKMKKKVRKGVEGDW